MSEWRELYCRSDEELLSSHIEIYESIDLIIRSEDLVDDVIRELDACISWLEFHEKGYIETALSARCLKMFILTKRRESIIKTLKDWQTCPE